ncbi:hypothetical protein [Nocardia cyriacigeorgica]|uniref:hypothetical protein n=1 Tax=Nocardia cyriacigeorgica TaxID=135487 RepID=UPI0013CF5482|nr:hypothetical protein [Nocardia cyriacigeorgica]NEW27068.1 hypothetical protein [Nocardia cyriacigeorgica]
MDGVGCEAAARLAELGCFEIELGLIDFELKLIGKRCGFGFADVDRAPLAAGLPMRTMMGSTRSVEDPGNAVAEPA